MIIVSDAFKAAWLNGNEKSIKLTFSDGSEVDGSQIISESFSLSQTLCEEPQFVFGLTSSAVMSVSVINTGKQYKGLYVTPTLTAYDGETPYSIDIGTYLVDDDVRSDDMSYRTLTAYDALKDVLNNDYAEWYKSLYSMTLKQFRDAFFSHVGIEQTAYELPHDGIVINIDSEVTSYSGADIIRDICEPNATFGFINYQGKFQYSSPASRSRHYPADDLFPSDTLYPGDGADVVLSTDDPESAPFLGEFVYSDYYTHKITQAKFNYSENTPEVIGGVAGNCYEFEDNTLLFGQTEATLRNIITRFIHDTAAFFYIPARVTGRARIWIQPGDLVNVITERDSATFPILVREISGITALYDHYEALGTEYYSYSANSLKRAVTENAAKVSDEIEDINENVGNLEISLRRTDDGLLAEVSRATGAETSLGSRLSLTESQIELKVSKGDVSSQLSMESGQITLSSGRLVIDSGNFQLDRDGNVASAGTATFSGDTTIGGNLYIYPTGGSVYFGNNGSVNYNHSISSTGYGFTIDSGNTNLILRSYSRSSEIILGSGTLQIACPSRGLYVAAGSTEVLHVDSSVCQWKGYDLVTSSWLNNYALASHTHSGYASSSHSHSEYATTSYVDGVANLLKLWCSQTFKTK